MTRRCLATHPSGGDWPPTCSAKPGHDGPHVADWSVHSLSGRIEVTGETWDDPATGHETHGNGTQSAAHPHPGTQSHRDDEKPAESQSRSYEDGIR